MKDLTSILAARQDERLHMVRAHGFYGGRGGAYRLDPAGVIRVFEVEA